MSEMNSYKIAFRGLSQGVHHYEFPVDGALFAAFENEDILAAEGVATVDLDRSETQLRCSVRIEAEVVVPCDRCLADCTLPIDYEGELMVKFSDSIDEYDGEVLWLHPSEKEVDLAQYIYESIILELPYQRVHADGECDPEMIERFRTITEREEEALGEAADEGRQQGDEESGSWSAQLEALKAKMGEQ